MGGLVPSGGSRSGGSGLGGVGLVRRWSGSCVDDETLLLVRFFLPGFPHKTGPLCTIFGPGFPINWVNLVISTSLLYRNQYSSSPAVIKKNATLKE